MRLLKINLLACALVLLSVSVASAIQIRLESTANPNQVAVYLDMEGDERNGAFTQVTLVNVSVESDDAANTYLGAEPAPLLPTNAPGILLNNLFQSLGPTPAYGQESVSGSVPVGKTWALVDFFGQNPSDGYNSTFNTTPENVLMATLNYANAVDGANLGLAFGIDGGFFVFDSVQGISVRIDGEVTLVNNVPEPGAAAMGLAALGSLGLLRRTNRLR